MSETISEAITLEAPISRGETRITDVSVRKPKTGELRGGKLLDLLQADVAALVTVLPRLTEPPLTEAEVKALDPADLLALGTMLGGFFIKAPSQTA